MEGTESEQRENVRKKELKCAMFMYRHPTVNVIITYCRQVLIQIKNI